MEGLFRDPPAPVVEPHPTFLSPLSDAGCYWAEPPFNLGLGGFESFK